MKAKLILGISLLASVSGLACSDKPFSGRDLRTGSIVSVNPRQNAEGTVVLFLSAKCPCSRSHEPELARLAKAFPKMKFVAVNSNSDETDEASLSHFKNGDLSFPVVRDLDNKIANAFGALKTPHAFIVSPKGECWYDGGVDDTKDAAKATTHYLRAALTDLSEGREPQQKTARTLGCVIKR